MENKLQQLTQKLYDEGLEKGRAEAERLVSEAKTPRSSPMPRPKPKPS